MATEETTAQHQSKKRRADGSFSESTQIVLHSTAKVTGSSSAMVTDGPAQAAQLVYREQLRHILDVNPSFLTTLSSRGEIGYWRPSNRKVLTQRVLVIDCAELRRTMADVLQGALKVCYYELGSMRQNTIDAEILAIVPITVDMCMTALYAKLRSIHRTYGPHPTRYVTAPSYSKDVELPLPLALAIQEFGVFETQSLTENLVLIPSYPEGTQHEGRANAAYPVSSYLSYVPTFRELKIPLKSIDPYLKAGSPWWTYRLEVHSNTVDLACSLPPSLYTDFSAQLRMLFLATPSATEYGANEIIQHVEAEPIYGVRSKELKRGINIRAFLALSHASSEWWMFS